MDIVTKVLNNCILPTPNVLRDNRNNNNNIQGDSTNDDEDEYADATERTLFCANLHEDVDEELLYEVFIQAGPIEKVNIPHYSKGQKRNYGFVTYVHQSTVQYALKLYHGLTLFRKPLVIKLANTPSSSLESLSSPSSVTSQKRLLDKNIKTNNDYYDWGGCAKKTRIENNEKYQTPIQSNNTIYFNRNFSQQQQMSEKYAWIYGFSHRRPGPYFNVKQTCSTSSANNTYNNSNKNNFMNSINNRQHSTSRHEKYQPKLSMRENRSRNPGYASSYNDNYKT